MVHKKIKKREDLLTDFAETYANLRRINMKLTSEKCVFEVPLGKLLGFIISKWGLEANLGKINTMLKMEKPKNLKDVQ